MRKFFALLPLTLCVVYAQAKIITVNNNPNSAGMYTSIQSAHDAASVGDTLLIQASPSSYGTLSLIKRLVLIGEGHTNVRGTGYSSQLDNLYIDSSLTAPPPVVSGTRVIGLYINSSINCHNTSGPFANNVIIERCRVESYVYMYGNNWNFRNCVLSNPRIYGGSKGAIFSNNIIGYIYSDNQNTPRNIIIQNNLFLSNYYQFLQYLNTGTLLNNIFYSGPNSGTAITINYTTTNLVFTSNMNSEASTTITLPGAGNSGTNNLNNTLPGFVETISTNFNGYGYWNSYSWKLASTSLGHNYGTDGKDIGIYGGLYPWTDAMFSGNPGLPYIVSLDVQNAVVKPGDKVKFNVKAKSFGY